MQTGSRNNRNDKYSKSQRNAENAEESTKTKKNKYVSLYGQDGSIVSDSAILKGRHRCNCQAVKHQLINNCLKCGRIVCEQEGSGPCLFCGSLVCSDEQQKVIESATKKGDHLKRSLMEQQRPKGWEEAMAQRNRLLEYDRASEKRTMVIDDESDYFKENSVWLSEDERKKLSKLEDDFRDKKHASRLSRKIAIDFAGRQIIEEDAGDGASLYNDEVLQQISKISDNKQDGQIFNLSDSVHPGLEFPAPIFDDSLWPVQFNAKPHNSDFDGVYSRVQDEQLLTMSDMRHCLSMHQPWASLLVAGIKRHEGRSWYSAHRGRLWIASTAKAVDPVVVEMMEQFYRKHYNDDTIVFPSQYPTASLLGCVSMDECLGQEEYREKYPDGESDSPFVFICKNPIELPIRFPVKGMHKICEYKDWC